MFLEFIMLKSLNLRANLKDLEAASTYMSHRSIISAFACQRRAPFTYGEK